jgi:hypothetical protein
VQEFGPAGEAQAALASLSPEQAAKAARHALVAGSKAEALVDLRGHGAALALLPDAREIALLPKAFLDSDLSPIYGRPPDARLPGART